jgi:glycosyltransferase involved in cell wall biosynthesis
MIWRFPDSWPMTGGCHFIGTCTKYMHECGNCPQLNSNQENDISRQVWKRKNEAWKNINFTVVVPTQWMKEKVEKSSLFGKQRIELIPNGLDLKIFYPLNKEMSRKALNLPMNKKIILYGAINALNDSRKGFKFLFKALQKLSVLHPDNYELVIFGGNGMREHLNMPVHFFGHITDHVLLQTVYSAADVKIVPSIEEPFGQTVIEAMACATPVVVFSETGPAGIIDHKIDGYVAKYCNHEDIANGIQWILDDPQKLEILSRNALKKVISTYDISLIAKQYAELYESMK